MARSRNIKPGFFTNEELAELSPITRLLFAGLWTIADRAGRLADRPKRIKAEVLPYDNCNPDKLLQSLHDAGFIFRYESGGNRFIQIPAWDKHQNPHVKEPPSTIPAPDCTDSGTVQEQVRNNSGPADSLNLIPDSLNLKPGASTGPAPMDGALEYLEAHPAKVNQEQATRAYLSQINTADQHAELMEGLSRHMGSQRWRRADGSLNLDEIERWFPPDRFITKGLFKDRPKQFAAESTPTRRWKMPEPEPESPPRKVDGKLQ